MKNILYVTTVSSTINAFLVPHIEMLIDHGYKVDVACSINKDIDNTLINKGVKVYDIPFSRQPLNIRNIKAFKRIIQLQDDNDYDIIHVHTPVASFVTRLALRNKNIKMMYTAHGFHFYKGAPIINWLVYYPLERLAARWTDVLITINSEDFNRAKKFNVRDTKKNNIIKNIDIDEVAITNLQSNDEKIKIMHGVGISNENYNIKNFDRDNYRKKIGLQEDDFIILVLAEINKNKNHIQLINAIKILKNSYPNIKVICAGEGVLKNNLEKKIKKFDLQDNFKFIGFRTDVKELINISNCVGLFSKREGLGKCLLEAMIVGKPVIATNTRGPRELIEHDENGFLVEIGDFKQTAELIKQLYLNEVKREEFSDNCKKKMKKYYINNVLNEINEFY